MEITLVKESQKCCGCGTCMLACPVNAIEMVPQELGCLYPRINLEKCIRCHSCETACAYMISKEFRRDDQITLAAVSTDRTILGKSASGGVFASIAHCVIDDGGIVFGCSLEKIGNKLTPMHIGVEAHEDIEKLQGSKYVQSNLGNTFLQIKDYLKQNRTVLFSGTPCQVDALKYYLRNDDISKLYTMDLICHGVPSTELFQDYISLLEKQNKGRVTSFVFRDKLHGWGLDGYYSVYREGKPEKKCRITTGLSSYYSFFLESETYRESCYSCRYANTNRVGDITIGDFWGFEQEYSVLLSENGCEFNIRDGISLVLVNNLHGKQLLDLYGNELHVEESTLNRAVKWNHQLVAPSKHSPLRNKLDDIYRTEGYPGVEKLFRDRLGNRYLLRKIKVVIKSILKNVVG